MSMTQQDKDNILLDNSKKSIDNIIPDRKEEKIFSPLYGVNTPKIDGDIWVI